MAIQFILVVESDARSRSDFIYIKSVLEKQYGVKNANDIRISPVFMGGKGNYNKRNILNSIRDDINRFSRIGKSIVVYCFDTDKYDSDPVDRKCFLEKERFCIDNGYEFVWFCHDVEEVFIGNSVIKAEKTAKARQYLLNSGIDKVDIKKLNATQKSTGKSNLLAVIDRHLTN